MLYLGPNQADKTQNDNAITDWQRYYQQQAASVEHSLLQHFYGAGMVAASTPVSQVSFVALDFETTGLDADSNSIVSIGLVPFDLRCIYSSRARQWLVKPRFKLTDSSVTVHRITHSEIDSAPDLSQILPEFLSLLAGKVAVVHYRYIEREFMNAALQARLGDGLLFPVIDTLDLEARLYRAKPLSWWDKLRGRQKVSIRLDASRNRFNLPPYRPHHAVTDAIACAELLQAQINHRFSMDTPVSELWC
ncbi:3'-5' exonuclease [Pseudohongiella sp.]|uniref:Exonuclease domain-containing protein n=1 Tax=marine sediment metagenome TaxID=412755 RepID=A0A0F9YFF2_9ZZZZ|nr:3'-5' exonuclease [Pseudohongiella sp.]HDZ08298.1 3'-5' exonuclease [Pseudohongiella sp.]HEA62574.1 3'-5' exonuclease [Pseudohongiella sp.]